jgi:hypothetical protein
MASSIHHDSPDSPPISTEISRSTEGPSAQRWNEHKDEIRELYERMPLKDVRRVMLERHGFRATYVPLFRVVPVLTSPRVQFLPLFTDTDAIFFGQNFIF